MDAGFSTLLSVDETARRQFEVARKGDPAVDIEPYLPPPTDPRFLPTLEELVLIDLEWAWKGKESSDTAPRIESYLSRFPQLRDPSIVRRLAEQEYRLRHRHGDCPTVAEFQRRFPELDVSKLAAVTLDHVGRTIVETPPDIPGHQIIDTLGRGGMGVVYLARQTALNRVVALKVIRGKFADVIETARFRTEAEAAARLNHPNIVQVYEVGEAQGRPYLALEYVAGGSLDRVVKNTPQAPRLAAETVERLARAVQAAHAAGVLHRDLKPANILLAPNPPADELDSGTTLPWAPKVADFGLAKRMGDDSGHTQTGAVLGTPSYMAPEQAAGHKDIGPAADVYALGGILYEMLTGRPPFRAATPFDTIAQVLNEEPVPPSRFQPKLPRDLETICLKCLEKAPANRYPSAADLAGDLRRFLLGEPISARRVGSAERTVRWIRRRPTMAGLLAALLVAALATTAGAVALYYNGELQTTANLAETRRLDADQQRQLADSQKLIAEANAREATTQKAEADRQRERAELFQYYAQINLARQAWGEEDVPRMLALLDRHIPKTSADVDRRGFEWYHVRRLSRNLHALRGHTHDVNSVSFHPDGRRAATASYDNTVRIWDVLAGKHLFTISRQPLQSDEPVGVLAFHPNGRQLAVSTGSKVVLFDLTAYQPVATFTGHTDLVNEIAFDTAGNRMATSSLDGSAIVWDTATAKPLLTLPGEKGETLTAVRFHPKGGSLAWSSNIDSPGGQGRTTVTGFVKCWDLATRKEQFRQASPGNAMRDVDFHPDGHRLAAACRDGSVRVLAWPEGTDVFRVDGHTKGTTAARFSPDGRQLASTGYDRTIRVWDADKGQPLHTFLGHSNRSAREKRLGDAGVNALAFSPDSRRLVSVGDDRAVMVWDVGPPEHDLAKASLPKPKSGIYSPDRRWHAVWVKPNVEIRDRVSGVLQGTLKAVPTQSGVRYWYGGRGTRIVAEFGKPTREEAQVWDVADGRSLLVARPDADANVEVTDDGRWLTAIGKRAQVWDLVTGRETTITTDDVLPVGELAVSPDGRRVATIFGHKDVAGREWTPKFGEVKVWDTANGKLVTVIRGHTWIVRSVAWSPDGKTLVTSSQDATVRLWEAETGRHIRSLNGHASTVFQAVFNHDGTRIASGGEDKTIRIWDPLLGEEIIALKGSAEHVWSVDFDPETRSLVSLSGMSSLRMIWDARPLDR